MNKVAIVTGAAMGYKRGGPSIGGAIAVRLAKDGYKVIVVDLLKTGQNTVDIIKNNGGEAIFEKADVTNTEEVKKIVQKISTLGNLTCLVNCAATYPKGMFNNLADIKESDWQKVIDVNLGGYFKMAKYCAPEILKSEQGTIINISSIESFISIKNFGVYSVSKAAINALSRSLAVDFAPKIRVNAICPGFVRIENSENNRPPEELKKWYQEISKQYPLGRVAEVEEIANVASFLASDQSSYITGQSIIVDGGKTIADTHDF